MTDQDRLEELLAKAGVGIGSEDPREYMGVCLSVYDCQLILSELRQLREIVREAESITKQIFIEWNEDHDVCKQTVDAARDLHNKIKEVIG